jgi:hypothetical protein
MATVIKFLGDSELMLRVQENVGAVRDAHAAAGGSAPFPLTFEANGETVYVNPDAIAYWFSVGEHPPEFPAE